MAQVKVIVLISAKPGIAPQEFMDHYEQVHAPLVLSLLPKIGDYRRNYLQRHTLRLREGGAEPDFDAMTEMIFADRRDYDAFVARLADPQVQDKIRADELLFVDGSKTRRVVVDEQSSVLRVGQRHG